MGRRRDVPKRAELTTQGNVPRSLIDPDLLGDIRSLIEASHRQVAQFVNSAMVVTYWSVGDRIRREVLGQERAEYGKRLIAQLSAELTVQYGAGFSSTNLFNMLRFAEVFPDFQIVQTLSGKLSWSHVNQLIYVTDPLAREFYAQAGTFPRGR
jgi:hypothetical protein